MFCPVTRFFENMAKEDLEADKYERLIKTVDPKVYDNMITYNLYTHPEGIEYVRIAFKDYVLILGDSEKPFHKYQNPFDGKEWNMFIHIYKEGVHDNQTDKFFQSNECPQELKVIPKKGIFYDWNKAFDIFKKKCR